MPTDALSAALPVSPLFTRLKLRHLRVILALNEFQSAAEVASRFHISPAAVSKTLAETEDIVGMELFERGRRGMRPTESINAVREGARGRLAIAFRTNSVQPLLVKAICAFHEAKPDIDVSVVEGAIDDLVNQLLAGDLDLLFAYEDPRLEKPDLLSTPVVAAQKVLVVASMTHPLLGRKRVTPKMLADQQWCIPAQGSRMLHVLNTAFRALNTPAPDKGIRTSDPSMTVSLLQSAHFLAVFPERIATQLVQAKVARVLPFTLATRVEPVVRVWNSTLKQRQPAFAFRDFILPHAGAMAKT